MTSFRYSSVRFLPTKDAFHVGPLPGSFRMLTAKASGTDFDNVSHPKEVTSLLAKTMFHCAELTAKWAAGGAEVAVLFSGRGTFTSSLLIEAAARGNGTVRAFTDRGKHFDRLVSKRAKAHRGHFPDTCHHGICVSAHSRYHRRQLWNPWHAITARVGAGCAFPRMPERCLLSA